MTIVICDVVKQMGFLTVGHYELTRSSVCMSASFGVCETYVVCTVGKKCVVTALSSRCIATAWPELCENSRNKCIFGCYD